MTLVMSFHYLRCSPHGTLLHASAQHDARALTTAPSPHRVFVNVHHDFGLEPRVALHGSRERASGRKKVTNLSSALTNLSSALTNLSSALTNLLSACRVPAECLPSARRVPADGLPHQLAHVALIAIDCH